MRLIPLLTLICEIKLRTTLSYTFPTQIKHKETFQILLELFFRNYTADNVILFIRPEFHILTVSQTILKLI